MKKIALTKKELDFIWWQVEYLREYIESPDNPDWILADSIQGKIQQAGSERSMKEKVAARAWRNTRQGHERIDEMTEDQEYREMDIVRRMWAEPTKEPQA